MRAMWCTESAIASILADELGAAPDIVSRGQLFSRGGLDSFDRVRLVELLEERFNVNIEWQHVTPENFDTAHTIARLVNMIGAQLERSASHETRVSN